MVHRFEMDYKVFLGRKIQGRPKDRDRKNSNSNINVVQVLDKLLYLSYI